MFIDLGLDWDFFLDNTEFTLTRKRRHFELFLEPKKAALTSERNIPTTSEASILLTMFEKNAAEVPS